MPAYYNEFDPDAADWLRVLMARGHIADGFVDERSIIYVLPEDLEDFTQCHFFAGIGGWSHALRLTGISDDTPLWTGSPPCQPFSAAGRQEGKDDERHLAPHFISLVRACRPRLLFGEQVASSGVFGKAPKGTRGTAGTQPEWAWLDDLQGRLEAAQYAFGASDIPAAGVGAPHIRQRTYFGAVRLADATSEQYKRESHIGPTGLFGAGLQPTERWDGFGDLGAASSGLGDSEGIRDEIPNFRAMAGPQQTLDRKTREGYGETNRATSATRRVGDPGRPTGKRDARTILGTETREHGSGFSVYGDHVVGPEHAGAGLGRVGDSGSVGRSWRKGAAQGSDYDRENARRSQGDDGAIGANDTCLAGQPASRPANDFWGSADWLFCRDGKWRPVESGTFPLAHGVPARVGRLRGYGNAIVPQAASAFVSTFLETIGNINAGVDSHSLDSLV